MRLLLDTHAFFWTLVDDQKLSQRHRELILERAETTYVSAVTAWEIALKVKLGKWPEAKVLLPDIAQKVETAAFENLPLSLHQAELAGGLDLTHRDPFDRMLAAQAIDLDLTLLTADAAIGRLGCRVQ